MMQCYKSLVVRKSAFCICENKDADQLRGNGEADQRLCFRYMDSTIPLLPKSGISSLWLFSVAVQPSLCRTWSENPKTSFLTTRLIIQVTKMWRKLGILKVKHIMKKPVFYASNFEKVGSILVSACLCIRLCIFEKVGSILVSACL